MTRHAGYVMPPPALAAMTAADLEHPWPLDVMRRLGGDPRLAITDRLVGVAALLWIVTDPTRRGQVREDELLAGTTLDAVRRSLRLLADLGYFVRSPDPLYEARAAAAMAAWIAAVEDEEAAS
jgi:hypothetical protein